MPNQVSWYIPQQVVYSKIYGELSKAELLTSDQEFVLFMDQTQYPVHIIVDAVEVTAFPSILEISLLTQYQKHRNLGQVLVVTNNPIAQFVGTIILRVAQNNYCLMPTVQDALDYLRESRLDLNWSLANAAILHQKQ